MKQTYDNLMREALRRRAERLLQTLPPPSLSGRERSGKQPRKTVSLWPKIASIGVAAAIVVGVFLGRQGHEEVATPIQPPVAEDVPPSPIPPQGEGVYTPAPISKAIQPKEDAPQVSRHTAPSLTGRTGKESVSSPSLSDLYATIDEMADAALHEADRLTLEAMTCGLSDDRPS